MVQLRPIGRRARRGGVVSSKLSRCLLDLGGGAVLEEADGGLVTWIEPTGAFEGATSAIRADVERRFGDEVAVVCRAEPDRDWLETWRRGLAPRRIGERIVVAPSWHVPPLGPDDVLIRIDPEMAFGTAEHGSTRTAIRLLEGFGLAGRRAFDIGTGSGILAIAAAKLGARVVAAETDPAAVRTARRNVRRNEVEASVRVVRLRVGDEVLRLLRGSRFGLVVANIEREYFEPRLPRLRRLLGPDGRLIAAGILAEEAARFRRIARSAGLAILREATEDGWWAAAFTSTSRAA